MELRSACTNPSIYEYTCVYPTRILVIKYKSNTKADVIVRELHITYTKWTYIFLITQIQCMLQASIIKLQTYCTDSPDMHSGSILLWLSDAIWYVMTDLSNNGLVNSMLPYNIKALSLSVLT